MSLSSEASLLVQSPGLPKSIEGDPVFAEPWHATAFALTVLLHRDRLFSWSEWADALSVALARPGCAEDGSDYFDAWVEALCSILVAKGVAEAVDLRDMQRSWQRSAEATPHGQPVLLDNDPQKI